MIETAVVGAVIAALVKSAPDWISSLAFEGGKKLVSRAIGKLQEQRHMELALKNAAERGLSQFSLLEERDQYLAILKVLSESKSAALRNEAMKLFTLSDEPDLQGLIDGYNLSRPISVLVPEKTYEGVDAALYLKSFFLGLIAELYNDPFFRERMSDTLRVRAAVIQPRMLQQVIDLLCGIKGALPQDYTAEQFKQDIKTYINHVEENLRLHKFPFAGILFGADEERAPELESIFVPLRIVLPDEELEEDKIHALLEKFPYLVLLGGPGSGKSTITRYIAWSHARANIQTPLESSSSLSK